VTKVVFCEDDPMIQKLIRAALRTEDHEVHVAANGSEGLELVRRVLPDVVFTDVAMPEMDGYQLAGELKADPRTAHIPIVFMTASIQRTQLEEARRRGAADVLTKPFTMADLRARLKALGGKA
jgi:CheY-like chemotaxis protein